MTDFIAIVRGQHNPLIPVSWAEVNPVDAHLCAETKWGTDEDGTPTLYKKCGGYTDPFARQAELTIQCSGKDHHDASWEARRIMKSLGYRHPRIVTITRSERLDTFLKEAA